VQASLCPDPLHEVDAFIDYLVRIAATESHKPVLFVASDDFLLAVARNRERLQELFLWNLPETETPESIAYEYRQYQLAPSTGIPAPATLLLESTADVARLGDQIPFPVFVKAREVTSWRNSSVTIATVCSS
jgi:predicted ATP-grasp superfamily ATP-dependent carboligase